MRHGRSLGVRLFARALSMAAPILAVACSSNAATPVDAGSDGQAGNPVSCGTATDTYVANLVKPGERGKYTFTLVQGTPAPPALDGNAWTVKIVDASGASPTLAQLTVNPYMPQMGHGSDQTPVITSNADGTFTLANIYLFMPGLWTITLTVDALPAPNDGGADADAGTTTHPPVTLDDAVYTFCVN